jgi:hypothetical protein
MKDKTIDYILRATWQAVARMYNEEASKYDASMARFCFIEYRQGRWNAIDFFRSKDGIATSLTRTLKSMEEKGLIIRKKTLKMVAVY